LTDGFQKGFAEGQHIQSCEGCTKALEFLIDKMVSSCPIFRDNMKKGMELSGK